MIRSALPTCAPPRMHFHVHPRILFPYLYRMSSNTQTSHAQAHPCAASSSISCTRCLPPFPPSPLAEDKGREAGCRQGAAGEGDPPGQGPQVPHQGQGEAPRCCRGAAGQRRDAGVIGFQAAAPCLGGCKRGAAGQQQNVGRASLLVGVLRMSGCKRAAVACWRVVHNTDQIACRSLFRSTLKPAWTQKLYRVGLKIW